MLSGRQKNADKEFLLTYWGPRRPTTKFSNYGYVMEVQEVEQAVFIDISDEKNSAMVRFIDDKDRAVAANCQMKKVTVDQGRSHCIFLANSPIQFGNFVFY